MNPLIWIVFHSEMSILYQFSNQADPIQYDDDDNDDDN